MRRFFAIAAALIIGLASEGANAAPSGQAEPDPKLEPIHSIRLWDGLRYPPEADGTLQDARHLAGQIVVYPTVQDGLTLPVPFRPLRDELETRLHIFLNQPLNPAAAHRMARLIQETIESACNCPARVTVRTQHGIADCLVTRFDGHLHVDDYSMIEVGPQADDLSYTPDKEPPLPARSRGEIVVAQPIFDGGPNGTPHEKITALEVSLLQVLDDVHNLKQVEETVPEKMKDPRLIETYREDRRLINATLGLVRGRLETLDEAMLPGHTHFPEADSVLNSGPGERIERIVITDRPWWDPPHIGSGPVQVDLKTTVSATTVRELFSPLIHAWYDPQRYRGPLDVLAGIYARSAGKSPANFVAMIPKQDLTKGTLVINIVPAEEASIQPAP